jgi:hypothetical protein
MRKIIFVWLFTGATSFLFAQTAIEKIFQVAEAKRIVSVLASDEMRGRSAFSPDIEKAAAFIADEFKTTGLQTLDNSGSYRQEFVMVTPKQTKISGTWDKKPVDEKKLTVITCQSQLTITHQSGYERIKIAPGGNLLQEAQKLIRSGKNYVVLVDESYSNNFGRLSFLKRRLFKMDNNVLFIMANEVSSEFTIEASHEISEQKLANVVGVLPGNSRKDEYVIFSAHYDHIGVGKPVNGDSIYNGANDNAAGTTAVILLARYFKQMNNNERTIVFAAFTAEETGGYGSQYFSRQFEADKVIAMFNIEMIGTDSKWGKNSAFITGFEMTDMGAIMQKNLQGTGFTFHPDPYPEQNLFYRSDNATLARLGVPAHTISTAKMDNEPHYHKVTDHIETLNLENMAMIIQSIALSAKSIIAGKDTPSRVKTEELR